MFPWTQQSSDSQSSPCRLELERSWSNLLNAFCTSRILLTSHRQTICRCTLHGIHVHNGGPSSKQMRRDCQSKSGTRSLLASIRRPVLKVRPVCFSSKQSREEQMKRKWERLMYRGANVSELTHRWRFGFETIVHAIVIRYRYTLSYKLSYTFFPASETQM
jgi:hypothetical protein